MGKHRKPKFMGRTVATVSAAVVSVPTLALTFTPSASATTQNIPRIVIPAGEPSASSTGEKRPDHIVQPGETLSGIAAAEGADLAEVKALNPGIIAGDRPDDYSLIYAGGHVHLPQAVAPPPPPSTAAPIHTGKHWRNCSDAIRHGWHDFRKASSGYRPGLDRDGDGIACETNHRHHRPPQTLPTTPPSTTPAPPATTPPPAADRFAPVIAPDAPGTASGYAAHTPAFWAPLIRQAMGLVGGRVNANQDVSGVQRLMAAESSGNPNAINNYDSNAQNGDPSRGLMQTIGATFNAFHIAGTSTNIYDPLANIAAALNYINAVYGGNIPNSPY